MFRGPNGAAARVGAQHSQDLRRLVFATCRASRSWSPYTASDAKGLLKSAIRDPNPVIFLENEILYGQSFPVPKLDDFTVPIGKARIHREGKDVTIVSFSIGMTYALKAAQELEKEGIEAEVIDLRTIRPMDTDTIVASVMKTGRCVTVEEGYPAIGRRRRDRHAHHGARLRLSRRAGGPRHRQGRADALCGQPRKARAADRSPKSCRRRRPSATGDVMTERKFEALNVPPDVLEKGGIEILRASVVDGAVSVALRRAFDDPFTWGVLLVDLARHAARVYAMETELSEEEALAEITAGLRAELDDPTDPGSTQALN